MLSNIVRAATGRHLSRLARRQFIHTRRTATLRKVSLASRGNSTYLRSLVVVRQSFEKSLVKPQANHNYMRHQRLQKRFNNAAAAPAAAAGGNGNGDAGAKAAPKEEASGGGGGNSMGTFLFLLGLGIGGYVVYKKFFGGDAGGLPEIKSTKSLTKKYLTPEMYAKLKDHKTKTSGVTLDQCIACAVAFDNQSVGIYAGDLDCYYDYGELFNPIIKEYHQFDGKHKSDLNANNLRGNINKNVPVKSTRIRVGRNIRGFGLSPGISRDHRKQVEALMREVFSSLTGDLAGTYYPLQGMNEATRQQLVDDHFLFISGDPNLIESGMERDWPEGRGIFHNKDKTFLVWVNEEDQLRIISMQKGGNVKEVFERLGRGIAAIEAILTKHGKEFAFDDRLGYIHTCPTNLGTGMRASVHIDLGKLQKKLGGHEAMKEHCEKKHLQARGTRGESSGETGTVYDISNLHRLGYTEVELVQTMIDGVNTLYKENASA